MGHRQPVRTIADWMKVLTTWTVIELGGSLEEAITFMPVSGHYVLKYRASVEGERTIIAINPQVRRGV